MVGSRCRNCPSYALTLGGRSQHRNFVYARRYVIEEVTGTDLSFGMKCEERPVNDHSTLSFGGAILAGDTSSSTICCSGTRLLTSDGLFFIRHKTTAWIPGPIVAMRINAADSDTSYSFASTRAVSKETPSRFIRGKNVLAGMSNAPAPALQSRSLV